MSSAVVHTKVVQNPLSTVNIYERWYVFIHNMYAA